MWNGAVGGGVIIVFLLNLKTISSWNVKKEKGKEVL